MTPLRGLRDENNEFLPLRSIEQAERDMAWRELKNLRDADVWDVQAGGGGSSLDCGRGEPGQAAKRPAVHLSAFYILAGLVFAATWLAAVLLEEPAGKPTPPFYKHFQERLGE